MTPTAEYAARKAFLQFFSTRFLDNRTASACDRPMAVLARQEAESPERAASGLRMAVNNCLEISAPWPLSQVMALDVELHTAGLPTLSGVRSQAWGRYSGMLKRGQVRNAIESAIAQGVLADRSLQQSLSAQERTSLQAMVMAFEPMAQK